MFDMNNLISSKSYEGLKCVIFSPPKVGKTTFAGTFENPFILRTEDGTDSINIPTFPDPNTGKPLLINSYNVFYQALYAFYQNPTDRKTLIIDSLDWLEPLLVAHVEESLDRKIGDNDWGVGYDALEKAFRDLCGLFSIVNSLGINVILLAHDKIVKKSPPTGESYDSFGLKLHKRIAPVAQEWANTILFLKNQERILKVDDGNSMGKKKKAVATGEGQRIILTEERPSHLGGNRFGLPYQIEIGNDKSWKSFHVEMERCTEGLYKNPNSNPNL